MESLRLCRPAGIGGRPSLVVRGRPLGAVVGLAGEGVFTNDSLQTFGGAGVVHIPAMQKLLRFICENGFEHHVAINLSQVAPAVHEALGKYMGWDVYYHK